MTKDICTICHEIEEIFQADEISKKRDGAGMNPLLVCRHCFDKNFEISCSGGRVNMKQKQAQAKTTRRKCLVSIEKVGIERVEAKNKDGEIRNQ